MSAEGDSADKEFEPTQRRLDEARKKGEIPRSADLNTAAGFAGFAVAALAFGSSALSGLGAVLSAPLARADTMAHLIFGAGALPARGSPVTGPLIGETLSRLWPFFVLPAALAFLSIVAQRTLVLAPSRLEPKLSKISPLASIRQKFGRAGLFEFGKSTLKLCIYATLLGLYLWNRLPRLLMVLSLPPGAAVEELAATTLGLILIVLAVALSIGAVDLIFQRAEHLRKNRMSRKEFRDEMKESEGDPQMKQMRRGKAIDLAMNQMLAEVPNADVIVVNPTHYAVALAWDRSRGTAPHCLAKGVDEIAARIRELAAENSIPIYSDPPTARALYASVDIGAEVESDHYRAVAAAIRFADRIRKRAKR